MNRTYLAIGILVLATAGLVALFALNNDKSGAPAERESGNEEQAMPSTQSPGSPISSIREAMGLGRAMRCTYSAQNEQGAMTATTVVEGERYSAEMEFGGTKSHALYDGQTQYIWTEGSKTGFKIERACLEELKKSVPENSPAPAQLEDPTDDFEAAQNVSCTPTSSANFEVPKDIVFTDQCALMRQSLDAVKGYQGQMPGGMPQPE